jgi:RHS repeat-associated protein
MFDQKIQFFTKERLPQMFIRMRHSLLSVSAFLAIAIVLTTSVLGQEKQYSENKTDQALKSDARVDPSTLGMSLEIPLGGAPGRGASVSSTIRYSSKQWRMKYAGGFQGNVLYVTRTRPTFSENSMAGWTSSLDGPWIEYSGREQPFDDQGHPLSDDPQAQYNTVCYVFRIQLHLPDGSSSELRKSDTPECVPLGVPTPDFTGTFYSTDGSRMRFDADNGVLYLADGGRYYFGAEQTVQRYNSQYLTARWATQSVDRNGNTISYSFSGVTDTLGRSYANPLASNPSAGNQTYSVPGYGGQNLTYTLVWDNLANVLTTNSPPIAYTAAVKCVSPNVYQSVSPFLFSSTVMTKVCADENKFNPVVLKRVDLPNGQSYSFEYNIYGEIVKITYPTGGYERFVYGEVAPLSYTKVPYKQANRGVLERWVSPSGNGNEEASQHWTYTAGGTPYKTSILAPNGTRADRFLHGSGGGVGQSYGFDTPLGGMAYEEATVINSSSQMLWRTLTEWQVSGPQPGGDSTAGRDPRVIKSINLILDTGGNALAAASTTQYDADLNPISTGAYDYFSVDATTAQTAAIGSSAFSLSARTPLRTEETTYLVSDTLIAGSVRQQYRDRQLLGLPSSSRVKNSAGAIVAQSEVKYDEASYPLLTYGAVTGWTDPATTVRGLPTTTRSWLNPTGTWLETHVQYDQCGSTRKSWDALGKVSEVAYSSTYHYAHPTSTTSADPDGAGPLTSLTTATVYDFTTGKVTSTTDANSQTTSFEYANTTPMGQPNQLQRLTKVNRPDGSWTKYNYGYASGAYFTNTHVSIDATRYTDSYEFADGLGRPRRSFMNEGATWIVSDTQYDTMGRVWRVSNPYRSTQRDEGAVNPSDAWTTSVYDALGRVATVTTPDNAVVSTYYSGNQVLVKDQASKERMSQTNALGQLKDVWEVTAADSWTEDISFPGHSEVTKAYHTSYAYDVLDNLTTVSHGGQTRTFVYDSLKRLTSATNPESGTVSYQYDANGNLTQKTDARNIVTTYVYDALNRNTTVDYSSTTSINPDITRNYDTAGNGKGRLSESYAGGGESVGVTVEHSKIQTYDAMGRPLDLRQRFKSDSVWGDSTRTYKTERTYDLFGHVKTQTYPSGRTVTYNYDTAGRLSDKDAQNLAFSGSLGDGITRTYSSEIIYSPLGGMTKEKFGTDTAIFNKLFYNSRGQLAEIRESTSYTGPTDTTWNRGAIINHYSYSCWGMCGGSTSTTEMTDNNGNLHKQDVYVPTNDSLQNAPYTTWWQQYDYDALNRLQRVHEYTENTATDWQQEYAYDRYGNRLIKQDVTKTYGAGINKTEFTVNTANNRLGVPSGQTGAMSYDNAGNLITDTYSAAAVTRAYDAENRMMSETQANNYVSGSYSYNADGQRVRRTVGGQSSAVTTCQVYGMDGELLAEYAANTPYTTPQKEYGYRNGQLLITAGAPARTNVALAANGGTASASSVLSASFPAGSTNNGDRKGTSWENGGGWRDAAPANTFPDWLQIDFNGSKTIDEVDVFTLQDNYASPAEPTETMTFSLYGQTGYEVQYWTGSVWTTVTSGNVSSNNKVWKKISFSPITTSKIRVLTNASADGYSRLTEVEAWTTVGSAPANINGLVADQLGTPRMVFDKTGSLANVKRQDYLPFGEDMFAGTGSRTTAQGYQISPNPNDGVRQKFTSKERDNETGLDYFGARYYSSMQGRFTGVDIAGPNLSNPQTLNKYAYTLNNPLRYIDRNGLYEEDVHLHLTRALAEAAGFSRDQAWQIATSNQMTDETPGMSPYSSVEARRNYHFTTVEQRYDLWNNFAESAVGVSSETTTLGSLGVFMHAQQDSYSHEGYGPVLGHGLAGHAPDKTYNNPGKADRMALDSFNRLTTAATVLFNNQKISFLYKPLDQKVLNPLIQSFNRAKTPEEKMKIVTQIQTLARENIQRQAEEAIRKKQEEEKRKKQAQ